MYTLATNFQVAVPAVKQEREVSEGYVLRVNLTFADCNQVAVLLFSGSGNIYRLVQTSAETA